MFDKPSTLLVFSKSVLLQISKGFSSRMFVKIESKSKLTVKNSQSCSAISS